MKFPIAISGLSKLTSDPRSAIRKTSLEVLFNILKDHGHLFPRPFWIGVFGSVIFPIFNGVYDKRVTAAKDDQDSPVSQSPRPERSNWDSETSGVAAQCLVDLLIDFYDVVRSQLSNVVTVLTGFIRSPIQGAASTGVAAVLRLAGDLGKRLSEEEWREVFEALKDAASSTLPSFMKVLRTMDDIEIPYSNQAYADIDTNSEPGYINDDLDDDVLQTAAYVVSRIKSHIAMQLLILQVHSFSLSLPLYMCTCAHTNEDPLHEIF